MTRREYLILAAVLHAERQEIKAWAGDRPHFKSAGAQALRTVFRIEHAIVDALQADNPSFDAERFYLASGNRAAAIALEGGA